MRLIKNDLKKLGIVHDNFFSESDLVKKNLVQKTVKKLQNRNYIEEGFLSPLKERPTKIGKK